MGKRNQNKHSEKDEFDSVDFGSIDGKKAQQIKHSENQRPLNVKKWYRDPKILINLGALITVLSIFGSFILNFIIPTSRTEIFSLKQRITILETELSASKSEATRLKDQIQSLKDENHSLKDTNSKLKKSQEDLLVGNREYISLLESKLKGLSQKDSLQKGQIDSLQMLLAQKTQIEDKKHLEQKLDQVRNKIEDNKSQIAILNQKIIEAQKDRARAKNLFSEFLQPKGKNWYADAMLSENYLSLEFKLFKGNQKVYCSYSKKFNLITVEMWTNYYTKIENTFREKSLFESVKWYSKSGSPKKKSILHLKPKKSIKLVKKAAPKFIKTEQSISFYLQRQ